MSERVRPKPTFPLFGEGGITMSERDPRVDPAAGDILRGETTDRLVRILSKGEIGFTYWRSTSRGSGNDCYTSLARWRKWAANAEVIHRAEDATGEEKQT